MSVKRYDFGPVQPEHYERAGGDFVPFEDYAALFSLNTDLIAEADQSRAKIAALEAELNRLRVVLQEIEKKGHGDHHGRGYTLANIADRALAQESALKTEG